MLISGFWLAVASYGFYNVYFYRLGRYGNDKLGMLFFLLIGAFALTSFIQLLVMRSLMFDDEFVYVRSLFGTDKIALRDIKNVWWTMPESGVFDLLTSRSTRSHLFEVTIGFDGATEVIYEMDIGRGWNKNELNTFSDRIKAQVQGRT